MRTLLLLAFAVFFACAAPVVHAQPAEPPAATAPASSTFLGLPPAQALAVGVGMLAGGVGLSALSSGPFSTVVGAFAGALIGNWWYATQPTPTGRTNPMRQPMSADLEL
ncbi:hypothetical protein [Azospirillum sp. TSO35-2]|uniref:hypothetical protein n=1 Tax=Azospirillum sp. TSO35-2 TaxID=716796 RepID=UPI000D613E40|nr:hypothetical protein [Azospirillum sp. TSO35-2]PWC31243.1 hypothetical protein TSO352_31105 [Azospirillum sp. TSO35-2]